MIIDFEGYMSSDKFENGVINTMQTTNTPFSYYREGFESLVILERQPLFFVFLTYIPTGHHTHLPTLEQSMKNENGHPRQSTGEWVVDTIFQTREADAKSIFTKLENLSIKDNIITFIREELYRF
ncbi:MULTISPECIES: hypothetical protein [Bacillus cereus group]|uniref:hypothetical protein n=1 Tax=Bacillus cereus group TaxID=86661 RepID=UPI0022E33E81|nr:hypothetical protein [Bacillus cereus group sp. TH152-1LC]MDA1674947.1 hypothetical protein [Bacillus cereus group sp. TH152-1LC]